MNRQTVLALLLLWLLQAAALGAQGGETALPRARRQDSVSLEEAFNRSRTGRTYSDQPLSLDELSAVLWAAAGKMVTGIAGEFDASAVKALCGMEETPILFLTLGHHY
jgi:hypothetical protein